ncbi:MAG: biotin/lipoyl-containing protein [Vicinamibacterales bacterium]
MDVAHRLGSLMAKVVRLRSASGDHRVEIDGDRTLVDGLEVAPAPRAWAVASGDKRWVFVDGEVFEFDLLQRGGRRRSAHHGSLAAPMPATVVRILATAGQAVQPGDTLIVLEAMKMELPVRAPAAGIVRAVHCREGQLVQAGVALVELEP